MQAQIQNKTYQYNKFSFVPTKTLKMCGNTRNFKTKMHDAKNQKRTHLKHEKIHNEA
jgi:hypothetical protein